MFSPIDITLSESQLLVRCYRCSCLLGALAPHFSNFPFTLSLLISCGGLIAFFFPPVLPVKRFVWDLDDKSFKAKLKEDDSWIHAKSIVSVWRLPGVVSMKVETEREGSHRITVLYDMVEESAYRRLLVAARFGRLALRPSSTRNL